MKPKKLLTDSFLPVLLIIIVGAFLFSGMPITKEDFVPPTPTPTPDNGGGGGGTTPTNTPAPTEWKISHDNPVCDTTRIHIATSTATATGNANGHIILEVDDGSGKFVKVGAGQFISPKSSYSLVLSSTYGFDKKNWRLTLFEGGSADSGGGTLKATDNGVPTGCN